MSAYKNLNPLSKKQYYVIELITYESYIYISYEMKGKHMDWYTNKAAMIRYKRCSYSERCIVYCYKVRYTKKCKLHFCTWWALNGTFISQLRSKIEAHQSARTRRHTVTCLRRSWAESARWGRGVRGERGGGMKMLPLMRLLEQKRCREMPLSWASGFNWTGRRYQ